LIVIEILRYLSLTSRNLAVPTTM